MSISMLQSIYEVAAGSQIFGQQASVKIGQSVSSTCKSAIDSPNSARSSCHHVHSGQSTVMHFRGGQSSSSHLCPQVYTPTPLVCSALEAKVNMLRFSILELDASLTDTES